MYKIFYPDNRIFDSELDDGPPPARGVQVILQEDDRVGPYFQTGSDYYVWIEDQQKWQGVDIFGLFDYLIESGLVLFGRTITNQEYQEIYQKAKVHKNTWLNEERKL